MEEPAPPEQTAPPEIQYRPLDDSLREEIREELGRARARKTAQDRLDKGLAEVRREVDRYAKRIKRNRDETPEPLDLEAFAAERGFTTGATPLVDGLEVEEYELGRAYEQVDFTWPPQRQSFAELAYQDDVPLYRPAQVRGEDRDVNFVYWRVEQREAFVPELEQIRDEVIEAWKLREARTLALAEARRLADQANKSGKSLTETLADQEQLVVTETNEFSWMSTGLTPGGMSTPGLSSVDGVDGIGEEFMRSVFALDVGQSGVAINQPETIVYVVRVASEQPGEDELRQRFLEGGRSFEAQQIANVEGGQQLRQWYEGLDEAHGVTWNRPPRLQ
jgi:hypothetical protein